MKSSCSSAGVIRHCIPILASVLALGFAGDFASLSGSTVPAKKEISDDNSKAPDSATHIECITPDGQTLPVPSADRAPQNAPAKITKDVISCPLRAGETVFIIAFPNIALLDRFIFINENAAARGELTIAVSNERLPASSSLWVAVDGAIPFAHKRLFNLSMLGVEARYVKLSFRVQRELDAIAANF